MNIFDLIIDDKETVTLDEVILNDGNRATIKQLIKEHRFVDELYKYGLPVNNKILLQGHSGCGKTLTAKAIANALGRPIIILNLANVVNSKIGETAQNIKQVFDKAAREKSVLFLDEFDHIGKARGSDDRDVGEMRRLVNNTIQLMDYYPQKSMLICATNHPEILDPALVRRFQLKVEFEMPDDPTLDAYYDKLLLPFPEDINNIDRKYEISFGEAKDFAFTKLKTVIIEKLEKEESEKP